jgi:hypothetical protein
VERFKFSREWLRGEATRVADPRAANVSRRLNLPPSYVLIHRVSTAGMGVLCQLESEGPFRAEMIRWMPGYSDADLPADRPADDEVTAGELTAGNLIADEPAAEELTTAEEIATGKLAASVLTANGLSPHGLPANGLTAKELTAKELTAEELTAGEPAADAAAGPGEPDPVGPAR